MVFTSSETKKLITDVFQYLCIPGTMFSGASVSQYLCLSSVSKYLCLPGSLFSPDLCFQVSLFARSLFPSIFVRQISVSQYLCSPDLCFAVSLFARSLFPSIFVCQDLCFPIYLFARISASQCLCLPVRLFPSIFVCQTSVSKSETELGPLCRINKQGS